MQDDNPNTTEFTPRRSGRERRAVHNESGDFSRISNGSTRPIKSSKLSQMTAGEEDDDEDEDEDMESPEEGSEEEYTAPGKKTPAKKGKAKTTPTRPRRRVRDSDDEDDGTPRASSKKKKLAAAGGRGKGRVSTGKGKTAGGLEFQDGADVKQDNAFFNAIISGKKAFEPLIEDWVETYDEEQDQALGDLVVFLIRASGSSAEVTPAEAVDLDGVVSTADDLEKEKSLGQYPLISKHKSFAKHFHPALSSFVSALIHNLAGTSILYSSGSRRSEPSPFIEVLQTWLFALSASPLRSFRHTGTVVALETMTALCEVASEVRDELSTVSRQRDQEEKKLGTRGAAGKAAGERMKELARIVKEVHWKKQKLETYLNEFFNTVFVMRYRDLDPLIRTECVKQLGIWMKTLPDFYLESAYFKYVGWMLDDIASSTRLETVKALQTLYSNEAHASGLSTFTERFKRRIVEMSFHDVEVSVRTCAIGILSSIDRSGMLDEEKRRQIGLLVFDSEARVRKAVSDFFEGRWNEEIEEKMEAIAGTSRRGRKKAKADDEDVEALIKSRVGWKCLAGLLVGYKEALEEAARPQDAEETMDDPALRNAAEELRNWAETAPKGRIGAAVESLWDQIETLRNWEGLIDFLELDHSAVRVSQDEEEDDADVTGERIEDVWKLDEDEEAVLLAVLVAGLRKIKSDTEKKDDAEAAANMTRVLIKALPRLITKHMGDAARLTELLTIPTLMNLELYLDLRMITAYELLWDDLIKLFLKNSDPSVLAATLKSIVHLNGTEVLANTNSAKMAELEEAIFSAFRTLVIGRNVDTSTFDEDAVIALDAACSRIGMLISYRNISAAIDEESDGASAWSILLSVARRGSYGYRPEASMVETAMETLSRHIFWRAKVDGDNDVKRNDLLDKREDLLDCLREYAIDTNSNALNSVKRTAFALMLHMHLLFRATADVLTPVEKKITAWPVPESLVLQLDDQAQRRCAGFIQAEIERHLEDRSNLARAASQENELDEEDTLSDGEDGPKKRRGKKSDAAQMNEDGSPATSALAAEERFLNTISTFLLALRTDIIGFEHAVVIFTHFGRFGPSYDAICRVLADEFRIVACSSLHHAQAKIVVETSLKDAFELFLDGETTETEVINLAKLLASCTVVHGAQFSTVKRMHSTSLVAVHMELVDWLVQMVADLEVAKRKNQIRNALTFFKVLTLLAPPLVGREALKIKSHLDETLKKAHIEVTSSKIWDHERAYEKRLSTAMSKDSNIAKGARKKVSAAEIHSEVEDEHATAVPTSSPTRLEPPSKRRHPVQRNSDEEDEQEEDASPPPAKRPKFKPKARTTRAAFSEGEEEEEQQDNGEEENGVEGPASSASQSRGNKRSREDTYENEMQEEEGGRDEATGAAAGTPRKAGTASEDLSPLPSSPAESVVSIIDTGRKRRRRT